MSPRRAKNDGAAGVLTWDARVPASACTHREEWCRCTSATRVQRPEKWCAQWLFVNLFHDGNGYSVLETLTAWTPGLKLARRQQTNSALSRTAAGRALSVRVHASGRPRWHRPAFSARIRREGTKAVRSRPSAEEEQQQAGELRQPPKAGRVL